MASSKASESFQIPIEAAEFYESAFVPAFFAQWAPMLCDAAGVAPGHAVLDVACGTGIVARTAADLVGPTGAVTGVDLNDAMLTVARRVQPDIVWRQCDAESLPFPDETFQTVLCQMALMFFPHPVEAVKEMCRVAIHDGTVAVLVPGRLDAQPAFSSFVDMATRHGGPDTGSLLSSYFVCGNLDELAAMIGSAGLEVTTATTQSGSYRAPSVDAFVTTEVESTPLVEGLSDEIYQRIRRDAHEVLQPFTTPDGAVVAPFESNIVTAQRP